LDGSPVSGVPVTFVWDYRWPEEAVTFADTTDEGGNFEFKGRKGFGFLLLLPVHSMTAFQLVFETEDSARTVAAASYQAGPHLERVEVRCELSRSGLGLCEVVGPSEAVEYMDFYRD
jgi:hypothetical protein